MDVLRRVDMVAVIDVVTERIEYNVSWGQSTNMSSGVTLLNLGSFSL
ncbi:MAG: hypothetical protein ACRC6S_07110 [Shewanella sp.]